MVENNNKILRPQRKGTYDSNLGRIGVFRVLSIFYNNHSILRIEDPLMVKRNHPVKNSSHCASLVHCASVYLRTLITDLFQIVHLQIFKP